MRNSKKEVYGAVESLGEAFVFGVALSAYLREGYLRPQAEASALLAFLAFRKARDTE